MMGSATGPPAVLMSVTVWELHSQCASRTLLLLFLLEIGQKMKGEQSGSVDEVRAGGKGAAVVKTRKRGNGKRRKEGVADITSYEKQAPCLPLMP